MLAQSKRRQSLALIPHLGHNVPHTAHHRFPEPCLRRISFVSYVPRHALRSGDDVQRKRAEAQPVLSRKLLSDQFRQRRDRIVLLQKEWKCGKPRRPQDDRALHAFPGEQVVACPRSSLLNETIICLLATKS